jgi:hypothetical protein
MAPAHKRPAAAAVSDVGKKKPPAAATKSDDGMKKPPAAATKSDDGTMKRPAAAPTPDESKKQRVADAPKQGKGKLAGAAVARDDFSAPWLDDMLQNMQPDMKQNLVIKLQRLQARGLEQIPV